MSTFYKSTDLIVCTKNFFFPEKLYFISSSGVILTPEGLVHHEHTNAEKGFLCTYERGNKNEQKEA